MAVQPNKATATAVQGSSKGAVGSAGTVRGPCYNCDQPCNTPSVYHQLSNGFKLKHDRLSDDGDVKIKPMEISPNLNSDIAPLLYI